MIAGTLGQRRLVCVSAGNTRPDGWLDYPVSNETDAVHDPGQAWNALTIGAYTQKTDINEPDYVGWTPLARPHDLGPTSTTSRTWGTGWPIKPDLVLEGGNLGLSPGRDEASPLDSLQLLTTRSRLAEFGSGLLSCIGDASAAAALAARMAAQLQAEYPDLWPEAIRALLVHSAEWAKPMVERYIVKPKRRGDWENLIRCCGFGVPNLERARWSAGNSLTLIAQEHIRPYERPPKKDPTMREMHMHSLPWPRAELAALAETPVELRVTLSYYVEASPGQRGWKHRHRYASHGLRFDVKTPTESERQFRYRLNRKAREEEDGRKDSKPDTKRWRLGPDLRSLGSIHSDIWEGTAVELAERALVGIYPVIGWWRERPDLGKVDHSARYALVVSIRTPAQEVDLYTPVADGADCGSGWCRARGVASRWPSRPRPGPARIVGVTPSLAGLRAALKASDLQAWLAATELPEAHSAALQRVIEHDSVLWETSPDSLGSCLLARTAGLDGFEDLRATWRAEVDSARKPWVRCLQPLPLATGLLRTLSHGVGPDLSQLSRIEFSGDEVIVAEPVRFHPTVQDPADRRKERLVWHWQTGNAELEPYPESARPAPEGGYPKFTTGGWGPASLQRSEGAKPVALPCPEEACAYAQPGALKEHLVVYGTHDEFAGGFVWLVKDSTLGVTERLETDTPVWSVHESSDGSLLLARTSAGLVFWIRGQPGWFRRAAFGKPHRLEVKSESVALSPSGEFVAVRTMTGLQVWRLGEAPRGAVEHGLPARFSPDGSRLVRGTTLYGGMAGEVIGQVPVRRYGYLEGGPALPWCHLGDRLLINLWSSMEVWDSLIGSRVAVGDSLRFPHWFQLAYDDRGELIAALRKGNAEVRLHEVPSGRAVGTVSFELERGEAVALSPSGEQIAVARGAAIEVRTRSGDVVLKTQHPGLEGGAEERDDFEASSLRFIGEDRIASKLPGDGWRVFLIEDGKDEACPAPRLGLPPGQDQAPEDWTVETVGHVSLFVHQPTRVQIALPIAGEWRRNPAEPSVLACDETHVELKTGEP